MVVARNGPPPPPLQEMSGCRNYVGSSCGFQNYIRLDLLLIAKKHGEARQYPELISFFRQMFNALFPRNGVTVGGVGA